MPLLIALGEDMVEFQIELRTAIEFRPRVQRAYWTYLSEELRITSDQILDFANQYNHTNEGSKMNLISVAYIWSDPGDRAYSGLS